MHQTPSGNLRSKKNSQTLLGRSGRRNTETSTYRSTHTALRQQGSGRFRLSSLEHHRVPSFLPVPWTNYFGAIIELGFHFRRAPEAMRVGEFMPRTEREAGPTRRERPPVRSKETVLLRAQPEPPRSLWPTSLGPPRRGW